MSGLCKLEMPSAAYRYAFIFGKYLAPMTRQLTRLYYELEKLWGEELAAS